MLVFILVCISSFAIILTWKRELVALFLDHLSHSDKVSFYDLSSSVKNLVK